MTFLFRQLLSLFRTTSKTNEMRHSYDASVRHLQKLGLLRSNDHPPMPHQVPQPEDEEPLGISFYRTFLQNGVDLGNLTIPRTFFGRSEIREVSFKNTDLTESNLRWNDFIDVDFTEAVLAQADLRASLFTNVKFIRADLRNADMRRSDYEDCDFDSAIMDGAILTHDQAADMDLSDQQVNVIKWAADEGPEPSGG